VNRAYGQAAEWERRYTVGGHAGAVRTLLYWNRAHMGSYAAALAAAGPNPPDLTLSRSYRSKVGAGLSWDQELGAGLGGFARLGFNDGRTESWAYTEIDRTASAGLSLTGAAWHRRDDTVAVAVVLNGLAPEHRAYLAAGGDGFILGDGALDYGPEEIVEADYNWHLGLGLALTVDLQAVDHPGYNRARGPVLIPGVRLHAEF
jgi:carbohydrate-selective porin OprB